MDSWLFGPARNIMLTLKIKNDEYQIILHFIGLKFLITGTRIYVSFTIIFISLLEM